MKTIEQLNQERKALIDTLGTSTERKNVFEQINAIDAEIRKLNQLGLLDRVNKEQSQKRAMALQAWEAEQPTEDITTNDGSLHKVKAKKYPKLAAIPYFRAQFKDGILFEISTGRETFQMYRTKYEYGKPNTYTRPETFNDFLDLNGIQPETITIDAYLDFENKLNEANKALEDAIKEYENKRNELKVYKFQNIGLVEQSNTHLYKYTPKNK